MAHRPRLLLLHCSAPIGSLKVTSLRDAFGILDVYPDLMQWLVMRWYFAKATGSGAFYASGTYSADRHACLAGVAVMVKKCAQATIPITEQCVGNEETSEGHRWPCRFTTMKMAILLSPRSAPPLKIFAWLYIKLLFCFIFWVSTWSERLHVQMAEEIVRGQTLSAGGKNEAGSFNVTLKITFHTFQHGNQ